MFPWGYCCIWIKLLSEPRHDTEENVGRKELHLPSGAHTAPSADEMKLQTKKTNIKDETVGAMMHFWIITLKHLVESVKVERGLLGQPHAVDSPYAIVDDTVEIAISRIACRNAFEYGEHPHEHRHLMVKMLAAHRRVTGLSCALYQITVNGTVEKVGGAHFAHRMKYPFHVRVADSFRLVIVYAAENIRSIGHMMHHIDAESLYIAEGLFTPPDIWNLS